jgi:hypothetical protein
MAASATGTIAHVDHVTGSLKLESGVVDLGASTSQVVTLTIPPLPGTGGHKRLHIAHLLVTLFTLATVRGATLHEVVHWNVRDQARDFRFSANTKEARDLYIADGLAADAHDRVVYEWDGAAFFPYIVEGDTMEFYVPPHDTNGTPTSDVSIEIWGMYSQQWRSQPR